MVSLAYSLAYSLAHSPALSPAFSGSFSGHSPALSPVYSLVYSLAYVLSKKTAGHLCPAASHIPSSYHRQCPLLFNKFMESRNPPQSPVIPAPWPPYGLCHGFSQGVEETSRFSSPGISTLSSASKSPSPNSSAPPYPYLHPINAVSLAFAASLS